MWFLMVILLNVYFNFLNTVLVAHTLNIIAGTPLFLIRDLLNFKKVTSFSDSFLAYGKLVNVVFFCGRITDVNDKDYHQRLIIDDGTSAILALVKKRFDETNLDDTQCNDESSNERYKRC